MRGRCCGPARTGQGVSRSARAQAADRGQLALVAAGKTLDVVDPATGRTIAVVPDASDDDIDEAVIAARAALEGEWSRLLPADRTDLMLALAEPDRRAQ